MHEVEILPLDATRFEPILGAAHFEPFAASLSAAAEALEGHTLWHVNSTETGGGVAEMLQTVLGYLVGGGIKTRWMVVDGDAEFFVVTKRIHNWLHGSKGDDQGLGQAEREALEGCLNNQAAELAAQADAGDVVVLHDPQTIALAPHLRDRRARVIWSCHVGIDEPNEVTRAAWRFLAPYVRLVDRAVFSRKQYAWDLLDPQVVEIIPPCIDAFSAKNQFLDRRTVGAILNAAGIIPDVTSDPAVFCGQRGERESVSSTAEMIQESPVPANATIVTQVSRWDRLKDHLGVMMGFERFVPEDLKARLILAGPSPQSVADDPEGEDVLDELRRSWSALPPRSKARVHIACLPMEDLEENAAIVNALQRRSQIIVQKSLAEGFGLTVAEGMWKKIPTLASGVGGIKDQIQSGINGVLVGDPRDLEGFGRAVGSLLRHPDRARELGIAAHRSVQDRYLAPHYLTRMIELAMAVR